MGNRKKKEVINHKGTKAQRKREEGRRKLAQLPITNYQLPITKDP
jgi:hypothetical protein